MELAVNAPPVAIVPPPSMPVNVTSPTCALPPLVIDSAVGPLPLSATGPYSAPLPPLLESAPATFNVDWPIAPGDEPTFSVAPADTLAPPAPLRLATPFVPAVTLNDPA